jgi:hypothetical protein
MNTQINSNANFVNEFMPSSEYRELYRATRKIPRVFPAGFSMPGYFNTDCYSKDKNWFILAIFIELLAFYLTITGGLNRGGEWGYIAFLTAIFFIVLDIVGAQMLHNRASEKTKFLSLATVTRDPIASEGFQKKATEINGRQVIGVVLIIFSAFLKYFALFLLGSFRLSVLSVIILLYLIVIYVHVYHSGFFFAEWKRQNLLNKEHDMFRIEQMQIAQGKPIQAKFQAQTIVGGNSEPSNLRLNTSNGIIRHDGHELIETIAPNGLYSYTMKTKGILSDDQIVAFTQNQNDEQCKFILNLCISHQITHF